MLIFSLPLALLGGCAGGSVCGPGTHDEDGVCTPDAPGDTADTDTDTDPEGIAPGARWAGETPLPGSAHSISGAREEDYAGRGTAIGDVDGDDQDDVLVAAPFSWSNGDSGGYACVVKGPIEADIDLGSAYACVAGMEEREYLGVNVSVVGDMDGDGTVELAFAAPNTSSSDTGPSGPGAVHLFSNIAAGDHESGDATASWSGEGATDGAGAAMLGGTDWTGDGRPDLAAGAPMYNGYWGAAYILGARALEGGTLDDAEVRFYPTSGTSGGGFGSSIAAVGDLDGDGFEDFGVGWRGHNNNRSAVAIFLGPVSGGNAATDADALITGQGGAFAGFQGNVAGVGDVNGDGTADVLVGAPEYNISNELAYAGSVYLFSGEKALDGTDALLADATIEGDHYGQALGRSVAGIGDQDGDGFADILVGAWGADTEADNAGGAYLYYGSLSGTYDPSDAAAAWHGTTRGASTGVSVLGGADLTGDAYTDLLISSEGANGLTDYTGVVSVVPGAAP